MASKQLKNQQNWKGFDACALNPKVGLFEGSFFLVGDPLPIPRRTNLI